MRQIEQAAGEGITATRRGTDDATEVIEDADATLCAGGSDAGEDLLSLGASGITIAAKDLSVGDRGGRSRRGSRRKCRRTRSGGVARRG
jgi:hypothetical protein